MPYPGLLHPEPLPLRQATADRTSAGDAQTEFWLNLCGVSGRGVGQRWPDAGSGPLSAAVCAWDLLKEVATIFIASTIVWPQVKQQGGNTAPPFNRKLD